MTSPYRRDTEGAGWRVAARTVCLALVGLSLVVVAPAQATVAATPNPLPRLVEDLWPGPESSGPYDLTNVGGTLFFSADDLEHGPELYTSDGSAAGTALVKDIKAGGGGSYPLEITAVGRTAFFTASQAGAFHHRGLWKSDGTPRGTVLVKANNAYASRLTNVAGTLFFAGKTELWKSKGTSVTTVRVKDINPNGPSHPQQLTAVGRSLFFSADDGSRGRELWTSDGTAPGTVRVKDINPNGGSGLRDLTAVGQTVFFAAGDGTHGRELWRSDGTARGTVMVKDLVVGGSSNPSGLTKVGADLYFTALDATRQPGLWRTDGTAQGTILVKQIDVRYKADFGGVLHFLAQEPGGLELWRSDGTTAGTVSVKALGADLWAYPMVVAGSTVFFTVVHETAPGSYDRDLWASDGTTSGTTMIMKMSEGVLYEPETTAVRNKLFVNATDDAHGRELWVAPPAGTPFGIIDPLTSTVFESNTPVDDPATAPTVNVYATIKDCTPGVFFFAHFTLVQDGITLTNTAGMSPGAGEFACEQDGTARIGEPQLGLFDPSVPHPGTASATLNIWDNNSAGPTLIGSSKVTIPAP